MENRTGLVWGAVGAGVILLLAIGYGLGCWVTGVADKAEMAVLRAEVAASAGLIADAKSYGEGVNAAYQATLIEIDTEKQNRKGDAKLYSDSLVVIRSMLPERAERELARYYRQNRGN